MAENQPKWPEGLGHSLVDGGILMGKLLIHIPKTRFSRYYLTQNLPRIITEGKGVCDKCPFNIKNLPDGEGSVIVCSGLNKHPNLLRIPVRVARYTQIKNRIPMGISNLSTENIQNLENTRPCRTD